MTRGTSLSPEQRMRLLMAAEEVAKRARPQYSKFRVGAVALGASGAIHRGANVEIDSLGLGTCAERVALAAAQVAGDEVLAVAVACIDAPPDAPLESRTPCGACRQWLIALAPNAEILLAGEDRTFRIHELLPHAFRLRPKAT